MAKILIIEDSKELVNYLIDSLHSDKHEIKSVIFKSELEKLLLTYTPDIFLIDVPTLCSDLISNGLHAATPIFVLSMDEKLSPAYIECPQNIAIHRPPHILTIMKKINGLVAEYKPVGKRKKFRAGELVNFLDGPSKTMTVVKYSLDSAERSLDHSLVVVTWMESKQRKIAKYPEDTLKAITKTSS